MKDALKARSLPASQVYQASTAHAKKSVDSIELTWSKLSRILAISSGLDILNLFHRRNDCKPPNQVSTCLPTWPTERMRDPSSLICDLFWSCRTLLPVGRVRTYVPCAVCARARIMGVARVVHCKKKGEDLVFSVHLTCY